MSTAIRGLNSLMIRIFKAARGGACDVVLAIKRLTFQRNPTLNVGDRFVVMDSQPWWEDGHNYMARPRDLLDMLCLLSEGPFTVQRNRDGVVVCKASAGSPTIINTGSVWIKRLHPLS